MPDRSRISRVISKFHLFIVEADKRLIFIEPTDTEPTWKRLGLTPQNQTDWHNYRIAWDALYLLYKNPTTRTIVVNREVREFINTFRKFANPLLDIIAVSPNATAQDEIVFNFVIKSKRKAPTYHTGMIDEKCYAKVIPKGGSVVQFKCYTDHESKRGSLPPTTGMVEVLCRVVKNPQDSEQRVELSSDFNDPTLNIKEVFTKSRFVLSLGGSAVGKILEGYVRWRDIHNPKRVGPWTNFVPTIIL